MSNDPIDIKKRLIDLECQFLAALEGELPHLIAFQHSWAAFNADVLPSLDHNVSSVDSDTQEMIGVLANNIEAVLSNLIDLQSTAEHLEGRLNADLTEILDNMGPIDHVVDTSDPIIYGANMTDAQRYPCPPYIASAYKWLRNNLHKPYPNSEELEAICADSNTTEKRIRSWFASARQRMGWTKIAKDHFQRDRADTSNAAYRALVEPDPKRPLDLKLMLEFVKMQVAAEGMYSAAFKPTQFVGRLSTIVVGMSAEHQARLEEMRQQVIEEENMRREAEYRMKLQHLTKKKRSKRRPVSLYPSPECSSESDSSRSTLVSSDTERGETDTPPPTVAAGRKRRRSLTSDEDSFINKRSRNESKPPAKEPPITLPSPPASADGYVTDVFDYWTSGDDSTPGLEPSLISTPISRKRRLSDADAQGPPKRPAGLAVGSRLRPVSDPLPRPSAFLQSLEFPDWNFDNMVLDFDIPDAVTSQPLDPSEPLHVEFFNWANNISSGVNTPHLSSESSSPTAPQEINLPRSESLSSATHELNAPDSPSTEFRQFLQDFPIPPQSAQPQIVEDIHIFQPLKSQPIFSQTMSVPFTVASDSWNSIPTYLESHAQNFDPPNFEPPLSKSSHPPSPADIMAQCEIVARQAKLEALRAHLEAAKKLEEELSCA